MLDYNRHDLRLLERLYRKLSPWLPQPDYRNGDLAKCANPACGKKHIVKKGKVLAYTRVYQSYQCLDCGARFRGEKAV
jgi:DNA-directed RNA polymerase subunit RPC12/RpoP